MRAPPTAPTATLESAPVSDDPVEIPPRVEYRCDMCGATFEGSPGGAGLFVWTRGEETRFEEPPLCERCAADLTVGALVKWAWEEGAE